MTLSVSAQSSDSPKHEFFVNKYYPQTSPAQQQVVVVRQPEQQKRMLEIMLSANKTNYTIDSCDTADISFWLTNPSTEQHVYRFDMQIDEDFFGEGRISADMLLAGRSSVRIDYSITPECGTSGDFNPILTVETDTEKAELPVILHVLPVDLMNEEDCEFYYNDTVCSSEAYLRMVQGSVYFMDLSEMFYDPDGDRLRYSVEYSGPAKVSFWGSNAIIKPRFDWYGKQEIVFIAKDGKGGKAVSRKIFLHVVPNNKSYTQNFLSEYLLPLVMLIVVLIAASVIMVLKKNKEEKGNSDNKRSSKK